jgi:hypothetical protein
MYTWNIRATYNKVGSGELKSSYLCTSPPAGVHKPNHKRKAQFPDDTAGPLNVMTFSSGNKTRSFYKRHTECLLELYLQLSVSEQTTYVFLTKFAFRGNLCRKGIPRQERRVVWRLSTNATIFHNSTVLQSQGRGFDSR